MNDERTFFQATKPGSRTPAGSASFSGPVALAQRLVRTSPSLEILGVALAAIGVFFALGIWTDERQLLGQPVWLKPVKFAASFSLYALTLTWLLGFVRSGSALVRRPPPVTSDHDQPAGPGYLPALRPVRRREPPLQRLDGA